MKTRRYYTCVPTSASRFSCKMLTLYDLLEIVGNDKKLAKWMEKYNIVPGCSECAACGAVMREDTHRGKVGMRCSKKAYQ